VRIYLVTRLRLISAGPMASAIQRFLSSSGWAYRLEGHAPPWPSVALRRSPMAERAEAARVGGTGGGLRSSHRLNARNACGYPRIARCHREWGTDNHPRDGAPF